jgi:ribosomal protection tetracycline resistance protein
MPARTLNLGILAHVDAGKTSLTERLLFDNGAIAVLGSVDGGDTLTDAGELERQRGITIRSAVAPFALGDLQVNLVDTPGHPDFIAEVERALCVLDGAVLVISAVEGVQAQTRVLMRSLRRLRLPTLVFVNKIDRMGARGDDLLAEIRRRLTPAVLPMTGVAALGTRAARAIPRPGTDERFAAETAELLAAADDELLARIVEGVTPGPEDLRRTLRTQTSSGAVHPVYFGSAMTGAGVGELVEGVRELLPAPDPAPDAGLRGTVFAVERTGQKREKAAYLRLFSGTLRDRQRLRFHRHDPAGGVVEYTGRVSAVEVVHAEHPTDGPLTAGNIGVLRGLSGVRVGDRLGEADDPRAPAQFSPPIVESVVRPEQPGQQHALHAALTELADEDPLIRTRTTATGATSVLLYGTVQQEVLTERLAREFRVRAVFSPARPVFHERPLGRAEARHSYTPRGPNEFWQTLGVRIEPVPGGTGTVFVSDVERGLLPGAYHRGIKEAALAALHQGLFGWEVTGCVVTITEVGCLAPMTTAADFRNLTPMVLMQALQRAGSAVFEPRYAVRVEVPPDALGGVVGLLAALGADLGPAEDTAAGPVVTARIPARLLPELAVAVPGLTRGEGAISHEPADDSRVRGAPPTRERSDGNPLDAEEYLRFLAQRDLGRATGTPQRR